MSVWPVSLTWSNGRVMLLDLKTDAPARQVTVDYDGVEFAIPDGKHAYLHSKAESNFSEPPANDLFGLAPETTYALTANVALSGGETILWVIEYDQGARLCHQRRPLTSGRFRWKWTTRARHRSCCLAIRMAGSGRLALNDLRIWSFRDQTEPELGDALVRLEECQSGESTPADQVVRDFLSARKLRGVGRALLLPHGPERQRDTFDQFSRLGLEERSGCFPVLRLRSALSTHPKCKTFEVNQLELLWQLGRMRGVEFSLRSGDRPDDTVLAWLERRQLPTICELGAKQDLQLLEEQVLSRFTFPVLLHWPAVSEAGQQLTFVVPACLDRHAQAHVLTGPGWGEAALQRMLKQFPERVLYASHTPTGDPVASRASIQQLDVSEEIKAMALSGNLRRLTEKGQWRRWDALQAGDDLRFPPIPQSPEDLARLGFVIVEPDKMFPDEFQDAKDFWAGRGVETFYREYKPWASLLVGVVRDLRPRSVLEFGCNVGRNLHAIAEEFPDIRLVGIDVNQESIEWGREQWGLDLRYCDEQTLTEFGPGEFDLVFTVSVLDHIPDIRDVCRALVRCASRNLFLLEVTLPVEGKVLRHYDHVERRVRESTGASYSWHVAKYLEPDP
ncbi:MAG: class I SAM-dependent methyltransferase, partial [Planctomycetes bacterium]|nr:class I SAM-dependent methyltransferase [Planctomycetota bacterium]